MMYVCCKACGAELPSEEHRGEVPVRNEGSWNYGFFRCAICGMGQLWPEPSAQALGEIYASDYHAYCVTKECGGGGIARTVKVAIAKLAAHARRADASAVDRLAGPLLTILEYIGGRTVPFTAWVPLEYSTNARILDYGSGDGWWLRTMRRLGYTDLWAYDIPHPGLERLEAEGVNIVRAPSLLPAEGFDCVRSEHVLEHLQDPVEELGKLFASLRSGGSLVLVVPNFGSDTARSMGAEWPYLALPEHLNHFTAQSLRLVCERAGFEIRALQFLPLGEVSAEKGASGGLLSRLRAARRYAERRRSGTGEFMGAWLVKRSN